MSTKKGVILFLMSILLFFGLSNTISADNRILNVKDFGAVGDGATDDTVAIKKALYHGKGHKVFFPEGTYLISSAIIVKENTEVYGTNAVIKAKTDGDTMFRVLGDQISIHDLTIDGGHTFLRGMTIMDGTKDLALSSTVFKNFGQPDSKTLAYSTPIAIRIEGGVENVMMDKLTIHNVFAKNVSSKVGWYHKVARGILISPALDTQTGSKNITIQNSSISDIGPKDDGDGIVVQGFNEDVGLSIINNTFSKTYKRAIKIQSPGAVIQNNHIFNSFHGNNHYETYKENGQYDMWSAISVYADNVKVEDNTIGGIGTYSAAIDIAGGNDVYVSGNAISNPENSADSTLDLIRINKGYDGTSQFQNITVINNSLMNGRYGVNMVAHVQGLKVSGNHFSKIKSLTSSNIPQ
ncbi:glycosyl hydrolase family 28-related protein [Falsibacillus albus]|uniref:Rhamnogalacturonase A/B/Epimerase-like pectate lyase domain-containing protein n=1 Tax=Falsibacillus albus TaxID=2478915 RepID=A0A3L7K2Q2_9BACI|nr:glycosyl hydrolase family 28-related protein [Falsibacillus albus]RLQ96654.1 hypothetical protein D9X91_06000 [Falsibacillus albus]